MSRVQMAAVQEQVQSHMDAMTAAYQSEIRAIQAQLSGTSQAMVASPPARCADLPAPHQCCCCIIPCCATAQNSGM